MEYYLSGSLDGLDGAQLRGKAEEKKTKHCWAKILPRGEHWVKILPKRWKLSTEGRRGGGWNDGWKMERRTKQLIFYSSIWGREFAHGIIRIPKMFE